MGFSFLIFIIKYNMGLLDLLLQNQSNLDINPVPQQGNGPVSPATGEFNTGVTQFQQVWDSNNTYINSFEGGTNVGIQPPTLKETGLDVDNPNFIPSTTTPNTLTVYPATALGGLGQSAVQFLQIWTPVINYNDVVVGAPTSPLAQSLPETGLDNTDASSVLTTVSPINPTSYPNQSTGEFGGVSSQYNTPYGPNNTYENAYINNPVNFDTLQPTTLDETGLDNTNPTSAPTTTSPVDPTAYPQYTQGEFNGAPILYKQIWNPGFGYLANYNPNIQPSTLGQTGLDNTNPSSVPTTVTPNTITQYPQFVQGEFNGAPTQYNQIWDSNNPYIVNYNSNAQPSTLGQTGLDTEDPNFVPTTTTPSTVTQYPSVSTGEFGGGSTQYSQIYNSNNTYLNNVPVEDPNSPQLNTLSQTGLDTENQNVAPTTTTPDTVTQYPTLASGEFNTGANQYTQDYGPNNTYLDSNLTNAQEGTLDLTGLDNTDTSLLPTAISPQQVPATPQILPPQTFMGEFGGAPSQFTPQYNPNIGQGYLNTLNNIISNAGNPQISALSETGLDVENQNAASTTYVVPFLDNITSYPQLATGELNGAPIPYSQNYTPVLTYNNLVANTPQGPFSLLEQSLDETGLDIENQNAVPTTYTVPQTDNTTVYPVGVTGELGDAPSPFTQEWKPTNNYYDFMKENYQAR